MNTVQIEIDAEGFEHLWGNSMKWQGIDWKEQAARFTPEPVNYDLKWVYWFEKYTELALAEGFLKAIRAPFNRHSDEEGGWLIVTDFASPCHR